MDERTPKYTIANDYDLHGDLAADDDPLTQFLIYFCAIRSDGSGDMGFTLEDFERHIPSWVRVLPGRPSSLEWKRYGRSSWQKATMVFIWRIKTWILS